MGIPNSTKFPIVIHQSNKVPNNVSNVNPDGQMGGTEHSYTPLQLSLTGDKKR